MDEKSNSISISQNLFNKIQSRLKNTDNEFDSVDSYVEYVLTELLDDDTLSYSKDEQIEIEKHLKDMGYI